jgi:hypothetical protein
MLYENKCARIACVSGMPRPPKKKKLQVCRTTRQDQQEKKSVSVFFKTHKNGIHIKFSNNPSSCPKQTHVRNNQIWPRVELNELLPA